MMKLMVFIACCVLNIKAFAFGGDFWTSTRAAGMGNAYTAVVDDVDSLFYNPAGLALNRSYGLEVLGLDFGLNKVGSLDDFSDWMDSNQDLVEIMDNLYGRRVWVNTQARSIVYIPSAAFGVFGVGNGGIALHNPVLPTLHTDVRMDYGMIGGIGVNVIDELLDVGFSVTRIDRQGATLPLGAETMANLDMDDLMDQLKSKGVGYSVDIGMRLTSPYDYQPTLSFVWRDVGDTRFRLRSGTHAFASQKSEMILGMTAKVDMPLVTVQPAVEIRKVSDRDMALNQKLNFGVEIDLPILDVRGGFHQGYYSLGLGIDLFLMRLEVATYGVEMGAYPGQAEDRRYLLNLAFDFGIRREPRAPTQRR